MKLKKEYCFRTYKTDYFNAYLNGDIDRLPHSNNHALTFDNAIDAETNILKRSENKPNRVYVLCEILEWPRCTEYEIIGAYCDGIQID